MILEYVWLDGYTPEPNLRSKIKVKAKDEKPFALHMDAPAWSFDGSSTRQAEGKSSDCILEPVSEYKGFNGINKIVFSQVKNPDNTPHISNYRQHCKPKEQNEWWFCFEQEYFLYEKDRPLGWPYRGYPKPQGEYYCGVGHDCVAGRKVAEEHLHTCLNAGIDIRGINAEVALGQWEYQCFGKGLKAADDLWVSRYILQKVAERYNVKVVWDPKPIAGDWNGSGLHLNFSNKQMRDIGGKDYINHLCESLKNDHNPIKVASDYGSDNDLRLTGLHETQSIDSFSYGEYDRGASIRIPIATIDSGYRGRLEDRRPASNADPYRVLSYLLSSIE